MSRIAVISDVHGNYPALKAVLDDIDAQGISHIYCLGDLVGYYCMINEVLEAFQERQIVSILGNHDYALVAKGGEIARSQSATMVLKRQREYIRPGNLAYLRSLPKTLEFRIAERSYFGVHGGLDDTLDEYIREISLDYLKRHEFQSDVLLSGQTHVPTHVILGPKSYANPGAVGQPRDGDWRASYLVVEGATLTFRRVVYEVAEIVAKMRYMGFPEYLYRRLTIGMGL